MENRERKMAYTLSDRGKRCCIAFLVMVLLFLPYAVFEPFSSDTNDDTAMNLIAAGAFGEHSQYLFYSNVLYGYLLKALFLILPSVNWYLWVALTFNVFSAAVLAAVMAYFLDYNRLFPALILWHFYVAGEFYQSIQYTRNAYLYGICGVILLSMGGVISSWRKSISVIGGFLIVWAFLVRRECVIPLVPFLLLMICRQFVMNRQKTMLLLTVLGGVMIAGVVGAVIDHYDFQVRDGWKDYWEYHLEGVAPILDNDMNHWYTMESEDQDVNVYDLVLLNEYHYADFDYFSMEYLKKMQSAKVSTGLIEGLQMLPEVIRDINTFPVIPDYVYIKPGMHSILNFAERIISWNLCLDLILLGWICWLGGQKRLRKQEMIWMLLFLVSTVFDLLAIIYGTGHTPRRATIGPRMCLEIFTAFILLNADNDGSGRKKEFRKVWLVITCIAFLMLGSIRIMNRMTTPKDTETRLVLAELKSFETEYYLLDGMLLWGERMGITDLRSLNRANYKDYFERFILSGGWLAETEHATHYMRECGITAPMTELASDPHFHYVVRSWKAEQLVPFLADYLKRRCGREITPKAIYAGNDIYIVDFYDTSAP
ncbi:MAG: hypothetical protein IKO10_05620 [Lachnospiraceae bacterium]|nr:hypothetical protein [Lachnospiraceae bacterium]